MKKAYATTSQELSSYFSKNGTNGLYDIFLKKEICIGNSCFFKSRITDFSDNLIEIDQDGHKLTIHTDDVDKIKKTRGRDRVVYRHQRFQRLPDIEFY